MGGFPFLVCDPNMHVVEAFRVKLVGNPHINQTQVTVHSTSEHIYKINIS